MDYITRSRMSIACSTSIETDDSDIRNVAEAKNTLELGQCGFSSSREVRLGPCYAFINEFLLNPVWLVLKFMISTLGDTIRHGEKIHVRETNLIERYVLVVSGKLLNK